MYMYTYIHIHIYIYTFVCICICMAAENCPSVDQALPHGSTYKAKQRFVIVFLFSRWGGKSLGWLLALAQTVGLFIHIDSWTMNKMLAYLTIYESTSSFTNLWVTSSDIKRNSMLFEMLAFKTAYITPRALTHGAIESLFGLTGVEIWPRQVLT